MKERARRSVWREGEEGESRSVRGSVDSRVRDERERERERLERTG